MLGGPGTEARPAWRTDGLRSNKGMKLTRPGQLRSLAAYPRCSADLTGGRSRGTAALATLACWRQERVGGGEEMPTEENPLAQGFRLGRYVLKAELGQGPMGKVYRAHDTGLNAQVAIYVLDAGRRTDQGISEFFGWVRSARLKQAGTTGPCEGAILPVIDVGLCGEIHFAVMTSPSRDPESTG